MIRILLLLVVFVALEIFPTWLLATISGYTFILSMILAYLHAYKDATRQLDTLE